MKKVAYSTKQGSGSHVTGPRCGWGTIILGMDMARDTVDDVDGDDLRNNDETRSEKFGTVVHVQYV